MQNNGRLRLLVDFKDNETMLRSNDAVIKVWSTTGDRCHSKAKGAVEKRETLVAPSWSESLDTTHIAY